MPETKQVHSLVPVDPARVGWSALYAAAAVGDIALATSGLPGGLGTLVSAAQTLFTRNTQQATDASDRVLAATPNAGLELERLRGDVDELQRRVTMWLRVIHEAGRHPDRELREALGTFGARVLVEDLDAVLAFEIAEALARMTALDFGVLEVIGDGYYDRDPERRKSRDQRLGGSVANRKWIQQRLPGKLRATELDRVVSVAARLERMGAVAPVRSNVGLGEVNRGAADVQDTGAWVLTTFGQQLLRRAEAPQST